MNDLIERLKEAKGAWRLCWRCRRWLALNLFWTVGMLIALIGVVLVGHGLAEYAAVLMAAAMFTFATGLDEATNRLTARMKESRHG
jgi:hypothetical protein